MANVNVTIRMDSDLKKQADELFSELGMSMTTAITLFAKQAVREQKIPFEIGLNVPNKETIEALNEFKAMISDKENYTRYDSFDDLLKEVVPDA
ncbi:MAG: type II toxin-antitoxin system RelB/DinJ family antitoxin [Clostridia bacterium]|nr:type II toxin-antitoxin system RelB/DinJ family antitoxin [Clostridia bacterium]